MDGDTHGRSIPARPLSWNKLSKYLLNPVKERILAQRRTIMQQVALITGASRGLGLALARALSERGWRLIIDARGAGPLELARAELAKRTEVLAIPGDVADEAHRQQLVAAAGRL